MNNLNRRKALGLLTASPAVALATPALAQSRIEWRMVTSWPKNLPGPGVTAQRLADSITAMSDGQLTVKLYAAGEIVPALEVFSRRIRRHSSDWPYRFPVLGWQSAGSPAVHRRPLWPHPG